MNTHQDKVAIVTGGKQGIGRGVADLLAERGAKVVIVNRSDATEAAEAIGNGAVSIAADVTSEGDWTRVASEVEQRFGCADWMKNGGHVRRNTVLSDWVLMKAGDRLLLKTKPTKADIKKASGTADHLLCPRHTERLPGHKSVGLWHTGLDRQGRLIALCCEDRDGDRMPGHWNLDGPAVAGWNGEWP